MEHPIRVDKGICEEFNMDSIKRRYISKLVQAIVTFSTAYLRVGLITRVLGPAAYGNFGFLQSMFVSLMNFLNLNTSDALFNYTSRHSQYRTVVLWYVKFATGILFLLALVVLGLQVTGWSSMILPDQQLKYIILGAMLGYAMWSQKIIVGFGDAKVLTVPVQKRLIIINLIATSSLLLMYYLKALTLQTLFFYHIVSITVIDIVLINYYRGRGFSLAAQNGSDSSTTPEISRYFVRYSSPLVLLSILALAYLAFDRWFLQLIAGSVEQGYFSISQRISTICMIFTTSLIPVWFQELSLAHERADFERMQALFKRFTRMLYVLTAIIVVFLLFHAELVIRLLAGEEYAEALLPVMIMSVYPLHQTYGQLNNSLYLATERTRALAVLQTLIMVFGIPVTYYLLAPSDMGVIGGFHLGSTGLAIKFVLMQFIYTNILLWTNCRFLNLRFFPYILHQFGIVILLAAMLFSVTHTTVYLLNSVSLMDQVIKAAIDGLLYISLTAGALIAFPTLIGVTRGELREAMEKIRSWIKPAGRL